MSSSGARPKVLLLLGGLALLALVAAGCEPLVNAPPGGGQTVTKTFRYGPFTLGPGDQVQGSPSSGMPRPAGSFGLKSAKFDVVDEDGNPVSPHDIHLHHVVMTTSARNDEICTGRRERFMGSGSERTPLTLWGPYTYLVGADDRWGSLYHLMNETPAGTPPKTVYIEYTLGYQPGANASNSRPVTPYFLDVTGCGNSTYDVPGNGGAGSIHEKSRSWRAPDDGIAVFAGGHLHEGAIDIALKEDDPNALECRSVPKYHMGHLASIPPCILHQKVVAGHDYRLTARYDNSQPWQDVMGIALTYVWWGTQ
jgi:hypothetical protein